MTVHIRMTYNSEQVSLLGVQSILMPLHIHRSHVTIAQFAISVSTPVAAEWLAASAISQLIQEWHVKDSTDPLCLFLLFILWHAEVILCAPSRLHNYVGRLAPGIIPFPRKVQKIRNDDQSLSPVTPLVSILFLSFLIP